MTIIYIAIILTIIFVPFINRIIFMYIPKIPKFIYWKCIDWYKYIKYKEWREFQGFGLHVYVGLFGMGKTISMVNDAYVMACRYKKLKILTNIKLYNFPKHTQITQLVNYQQIIDCEGDTLILIDELSALFNSRTWTNFPMPLLSQLLQVRKEKKMIFGTAQRFAHIDKLMRDVTYSVIDCNNFLKRFQFKKTFYAWEYEQQNSMMPAKPIEYGAFIATDAIRKKYDTMQLIDNMKKADFISNTQILEKQGNNSQVTVLQETKKPSLLNKKKKVG